MIYSDIWVKFVKIVNLTNLYEGLRVIYNPGVMEIKREPPGTRSEHAGAKTNSIGANDATNIGFTSVPSKQKSTQKGSLLKSTQKTLLGTLVFVSFVLFLLRLFCNNLFYNTIELVILFPAKIDDHRISSTPYSGIRRRTHIVKE